MKTKREELFGALGDLSLLYPSMRFGQLIVMVAGLADADTVAEIERTSDDQLLQQASEHASNRSKLFERDFLRTGVLPTERIQLLECLRGALFDESLAHALTRLAASRETTVYDLEDECLLELLNPQIAVA
jgi:hypothetical protein